MTIEPTTPATLTALSLGAGVQSTALLLLAAEGVLPKPDVAIFADTGWESPALYAHMDRLEQVATGAGIELHRVSNGDLRRDALDPGHRYASVPYFILAPEGATTKDPIYSGENDPETGQPVIVGYGPERAMTRAEREGIGRRQCTSEYKLVPIRRKVRELLGAKPPAYRRVPAGRVCVQWVGFSTDEQLRVNRHRDSGGLRYLRTEYPLLDLGMSRADCVRWLTARGWGDTQKSACIGCPFHGARQWRDLRDNYPAEWADAVAFDAAIRDGGANALPAGAQAFLHRSRVPLDQAPIDRVTRAEWAEAQTTVFDQIADQAVDRAAEDGDPDGCSPFGCRSGAPAAGPVLLPVHVPVREAS